MKEGQFVYPHDFAWVPRLEVSRTDVGRFRLDTPPKSLAPSGRIYNAHVDIVRGDDRNGDGSIARPFRSIARAWMLDPDGFDTIDIIVEVASLPPGRILWGANGQCPSYTRPLRPKHIKLRASDGGRLVIAACGLPQPSDRCNSAPVWTPSETARGVYATPIEPTASPLCLPYDLSPAALKSNGGRPLAARRAKDEADVATAAGSAFVDPERSLLFYRPFDDRNLIGDPYVTAGSVGPGTAYALNVSVGNEAVAGKTVYLEAITVIGGSGGIRGTNQSSGRTIATVVLDDVEVFGQAENAIQFAGGYDLYVIGGAYGGAAKDALNVHAAGAYSSAVEVMQARIFAYDVDASGFTGLAKDGRNNSATLHEWCQGAYFNCRFAASDGRVVGFVDNARGVVAGCVIGGSQALDASGFRTMVSVSDSAVADLYECRLLPQIPGQLSPTVRAEPRARLRLHGMSRAAMIEAGLTVTGEPNIVEEDARSTLHPTAGPLCLYNRLVQRGSTTRLYVRGVWHAAMWSAMLENPADGETLQGFDGSEHFLDVTVAPFARSLLNLHLVHAPRGVSPWTFDVTLDVATLPSLQLP